MQLEELTDQQLEKALKERKAAAKKAQAVKKSAYAKDKDSFIELAIENAEVFSSELQKLKDDVINHSNNFHKLLWEIHGKEEKKQKKFTLENEAGTMRVECSRQDRMKLTSEAEVHIETIKMVMRDKFQSRNKSMYNILESLLIKNKAGDYDEKMVVKLNKHREDVSDERFSDALDFLANCMVATSTAKYVRFYKKGESGEWKAINMSFSNL